MKFSCTTNDLLQGLQITSRAIGTDQVLPILQNIHIDASGGICTLTATNLELSIITSFPCTIESEGKLTVPAKALLNFIQYHHHGTILIESEEGTQLRLKSTSAKAVINGEGSQGYPTITIQEPEREMSLEIEPFLEALHITTFSCAKNSARPVLSGVLFSLHGTTLTLASTDSYRLSEYTLSLQGDHQDFSCIIPARFLEELRGVLALTTEQHQQKTMNLQMSTQQIQVKIGTTTLQSRLIDGRFPDYKLILPKEKKTTVTLGVKDLLTTVKRMHFFAKEQSNNITFTMKGTDVQLTTRQSQLGKDEAIIMAHIEGQENAIALSSTYLIDFLTRLSTDEVKLEVIDKMHPAVFRVVGRENFLHLIMPLRITDTSVQ